MQQSQFICPHCQREYAQEFAFCPHCGTKHFSPDALPEESLSLLEKARREEDPVRKHKMLEELREKHPDCLEIQREILMLGRLYQRDRREVSFHLIKCYLLQIYLDDRELSRSKIEEMRRELFCDPQLALCRGLAPDPELFTREYLTRLSEEFIQLFLESSNQYMNSFFGFVNHRKAPALLAPYAARMLDSMNRDEELTESQRQQLTSAFYQAFRTRMNGDTARLDEQLGRLGLTI